MLWRNEVVQSSISDEINILLHVFVLVWSITLLAIKDTLLYVFVPKHLLPRWWTDFVYVTRNKRLKIIIRVRLFDSEFDIFCPFISDHAYMSLLSLAVSTIPHCYFIVFVYNKYHI